MEPTSPPVNPVNVLMADIALITQYVRAYNKRPLPATEDQVKALVKLTGRDRPLVVQVETAEVVKQVLDPLEQSMERLLSRVEQLVVGISTAQATTANSQAQAALIAPGESGRFKSAGWWVAGGLVGAMLLFGVVKSDVLGQLLPGGAPDYERVMIEDTSLRNTNEYLVGLVLRYEAQIKTYQEKNPAANDFPAFKQAQEQAR